MSETTHDPQGFEDAEAEERRRMAELTGPPPCPCGATFRRRRRWSEFHTAYAKCGARAERFGEGFVMVLCENGRQISARPTPRTDG